MTHPHQLGLILCSYNMARELPRTLQSLARPYQREIDSLDYQVIVVDNGSRQPAQVQSLTRFGLDLRLMHCDAKSASPVQALNMGLAACDAQNIGVMIDGARMASPRLLAAADRALRMHPRAIVFTQSLQLGHAPQWLAPQTGYNQDSEDALLDGIDWANNGYRLFEISSWPRKGNDIRRWLEPAYESNALFMSRALWDETGGYDLGFQAPGGGFASHDLFARACALPDTQLIHVLGEATFHQFHADSSSSSHADAPNQIMLFAREYARLRQKKVRPIDKPSWMVQLAPLSDITPASRANDRYITLLKQVILNETGLELEAKLEVMMAAGATEPKGWALADAVSQLQKDRAHGLWRGRLPESLSMIGRKRLDQLGQSIETILAENIAGDFMECGVWRGGACLLMAGILAQHHDTQRSIWLADSFAGFPPMASSADETESSAFLDHFTTQHPNLAVSQDEVQATLARFGLFGPQIRFLKGWFSNTLPTAPIEKLALLRLDGDSYGATMQALDHLYDKLTVGGFLIVDDYSIPDCRAAVKAFRDRRGIIDPIQRIDWMGVFWRKGS